jgi:hypothetical protein
VPVSSSSSSKPKDEKKDRNKKHSHSYHPDKREEEEKKRDSDRKKDGGESRTALHVAAAMGNMDAVKMLLKKGARTNIRDGNGKTAGKVAAENGRTEIVELWRAVGEVRRKWWI